MSEELNQHKREQLLAMLESGLVMLHLDPRGETVKVPAQFQGDPVLRLNVAYGFKLPVFEIDEQGVYAVLSFGGKPFGCDLPWSAIFAMTAPNGEHEGVLWPESVPPELRSYLQGEGLSTGAVSVSLQVTSRKDAPDTPAPAKRGSEAPTPHTPVPLRPQRRFAVHEGGASQGGERDAGPNPSGAPGSSDAPGPDDAPKAKPRRPVLTVVK